MSIPARYVVAAMALVAVLPSWLAFGVIGRGRGATPGIVALAVVLTSLAAVAASALWARVPLSATFSLGDVMLWSWGRRRLAEWRITRAARRLGFDREARFGGGGVAAPAKRARAILSLSRALDDLDPYTRWHSRRVQKLVGRLARRLDLSDEERDAAVLAAALHDVGNLRVPPAVLRNQVGLSREERALIEGHAVLGAAIAHGIDPAVATPIRHHHERWDGRGYPSGLVGTQIPLTARLLAIAESFDAMTSARPYRPAFDRDHAINVLRAQAGSQFDPELVEEFIASLGRRRLAGAFIPITALLAVKQLTSSLRASGLGGVAATAALGVAVALAATGLQVPKLARPGDRPHVAAPRTKAEPSQSAAKAGTRPGGTAAAAARRRPRQPTSARQEAPAAAVVLGTHISSGDRPRGARPEDRTTSRTQRPGGEPRDAGGAAKPSPRVPRAAERAAARAG